MNVLTFERLRVPPPGPDGGAPLDILVPVIDGIRLCEITGDRFPGVNVADVAPPSRHWLGAPTYLVDDRVVLLDGGCGEPECCGVMGRIDVTEDLVRWHDLFARGRPALPPGLDFAFDRDRYDEAIAAVGR